MSSSENASISASQKLFDVEHRRRARRRKSLAFSSRRSRQEGMRTQEKEADSPRASGRSSASWLRTGSVLACWESSWPCARCSWTPPSTTFRTFMCCCTGWRLNTTIRR
uniref:IBB domain-containing protein n=1 Tax=Steinernema glaseri TaxID=37863 RepID=A0A1I8A0N2_9BILA